MIALWCPEGYTSFGFLLSVVRTDICTNNTWSIPEILFENIDKKSNDRSLSSNDNIDEAVKLKIEQRLRFMEDKIAIFLASDYLRTAGIEISTGKLVIIPVETWRVIDKHSSFFSGTAIHDAFNCKDLSVPNTDGIFRICRPIVAVRDLAIAFGAENPPSAPSLMPSGWNGDTKSLATSPTSSWDDAAVRLWMRGYAAGINDMGAKPKREPTLTRCRKETGCTYRRAEAAWDALPEDWKNPPRIPKT